VDRFGPTAQERQRLWQAGQDAATQAAAHITATVHGGGSAPPPPGTGRPAGSSPGCAWASPVRPSWPRTVAGTPSCMSNLTRTDLTPTDSTCSRSLANPRRVRLLTAYREHLHMERRAPRPSEAPAARDQQWRVRGVGRG
jgi:hypothetical protein